MAEVHLRSPKLELPGGSTIPVTLTGPSTRLDIAVRTRMSYDAATRDYVDRRRSEGRSNREIRRCLKRYVCRSVFRQLQTCMA